MRQLKDDQGLLKSKLDTRQTIQTRHFMSKQTRVIMKNVRNG